jgi:hypothetical protein
MSDDDKKAAEGTADEADTAHRRIAIGKLTTHQKRERSCRRDSFAGNLGAPFQYQGNVMGVRRARRGKNRPFGQELASAPAHFPPLGADDRSECTRC